MTHREQMPAQLQAVMAKGQSGAVVGVQPFGGRGVSGTGPEANGGVQYG